MDGKAKQDELAAYSIPAEGDEGDETEEMVTKEKDDNAEKDNEGVPTDTGWAWVICVCVFLDMLIIIGFNRCLSVLFVDIVEEFKEPATVITLMFTVHALSGSVASMIISNIVMPRFSVRSITVVAAILNALTSILLSVAPNIIIFLLLFILKGLAFGALLVGPMSLIGYYFKKRRSLASSVSNAGFCVAYITFPPITELLRSELGMRGSFLVVAAIEMHLIAIAMLLRPPDSYKRIYAARMKKQQLMEAEKAKLLTPIYKGSINGTPKTKLTSSDLADSAYIEVAGDKGNVSRLENGHPKVQRETEGGDVSSDPDMQVGVDSDMEMSVINKNGPLRSMSQQENPKNSHSTNEDTLTENINEEERLLEKFTADDGPGLNDESFRQRSFSDAKYIKPKLGTQDRSAGNQHSPPIFSSLHNLERTSTTPCDNLRVRNGDLSRRRQDSQRFVSQLSVISLTEVPYVPPLDEEESSGDEEGKKKSKCRLKNIIDLSLFKIWLFVMISIFLPLAVFANYLYVYMPAIAFTTGISKPEAATIMTVCGVMDLITRIITGFIGDLKFVSKAKMVAFSTFIIAIVCQCSRFFNTYTLFVVFSILVGIFGGFRQNFMNVMLLEYVGVEKIAKAHGICVMLGTLTMSVNHPVIGAMLDATGNFVAPLHYVGAMVFVATFVLMCEPFFRRLDEKRLAKQKLDIKLQEDPEQEAKASLKQ